MKLWNSFAKAGAAGGLVMALAAPASAMTCEEFNAMGPDMQRGILMGLEAGRHEAREMARGNVAEDAGEGVIVSEDDDMEGGREEHRERARAVDDAMFKQVVDDCKNSPDLDVTGVLPPGPKQR